MHLEDVLRPAHCGVDRRYADKDACLADLARRAGLELNIPAVELLEGLRHREALGSTGIGNGIALPHARTAGISTPYVAVARLRDPIDFDAIDGHGVDIVCFVLLPSDGPQRNDVLACVARCLRNPAILADGRKAKDAIALHAALTSSRERLGSDPRPSPLD